MKKFLAVLLIALVVCEAIEETNLSGTNNNLAILIQKLKDLGVWDLVVSQGKEIAYQYCKQYLDKTFCEIGINYIAYKLGLQNPDE